jgi:PAS domain S-box-containing protein
MDPATMSYARLLEAYQALQAHLRALEGTAAGQPSAPGGRPAARDTARSGAAVSVLEASLAGGGEMGQRIRAYDWAATPLGPVEAWPPSLRSAVSLLLPSKAQIVLFWGPDLITLYNDAYAPVFGAKHPWALGRPARECWSEVWHVLAPLFEGVVRTGDAFWAQEHPFLLQRQGFLEETYFDVSYDPVRIEDGSVGGVFCIVSEQTGRVLGARRLRTLRELGVRTADAPSPGEVCREAATALALDPADLPFALLYLFDPARDGAALVGQSGVAPEDLAVPRDVLCTEVDAFAGTRAGQATEVETAVFVRRVSATAAARVLVLPLTSGAQVVGALVAGVSRYLRLAGDYRDFFDLAAARISAAIAHARVYEEERHRAEALAQLDVLKTQFFANISHEFRTPLTLLLGPLEDTLADDGVPPAVHTRLTVAHRNGQRLLKLVNTLLDFARLEAGRLQATYEPTDLAAVTRDLASAFRSLLERAGLRFRVDCAALREPVYVDRAHWEKVVFNLLSNAFKFTFQGEIAVALREEQGWAVLRIRDSGTGIPADELPHLFERFHRVAGAPGRSYEGTGIGLALVQELVHLHAGTIAVESREGYGSTFTVRLPLGTAHLAPDQVRPSAPLASTALGSQAFLEEATRWLPEAVQPPAETVPTSRAASGERPRVLLADDNADMRDYIRQLLAPDYEVEAVADGEAALTAVADRPPDMVLADVMMPRMDGFALLRALRSAPHTQTLPVILLSARAGEEARVEGLDAGADDYLIKPFSARELVARVRAQHGRKRLLDVQQQAEAARAQLAAIVDSSEDAIIGQTLEGVITSWNQGAERLYGYTAAETIGQPLALLVPPDLPDELPQLLVRLQRGERVAQYETQRVHQDGTRLDVSLTISPIRDRTGRIVGAAKIARDITARKQTEAALRELNATLEQRVQDQTALLGLIERLTRAANEAPTSAAALQAAVDHVCAFTGWPIGHVYLAVAPGADRWAPTPLWHLADAPRFAAFQQATAGLELAAGEGLVGRVGARGQPEWRCEVATDPTFRRRHSAQAVGLRTGVAWPVLVGQEVAGVIECYTPAALAPQPTLLAALTQMGTQLGRTIERERALAQVQRQQEALFQREKLAAMSTLLASVAHELNNPLASIGLQAELLREDVAEGPLAEPVAAITQAAARCERLVRQFLTLARQHPPERTTVALNALVAETVDLLAYPLQVDNVAVHLHLDAQVPPLWGDAHQLQQVLLNLLTNAQQALRAAPGAREVTCTTHYDPAPHQITLTVADTGPGIPPALQARIFEPFFTTKPPGVGTGLGLPLCRGIVEAHGGTLEVRSTPGHGATFQLTLVVGTVPLPPRTPPRPVAAPGGRRGTILVVDDEVSLASGLARLLRRDGHTVDTVPNGALALAHLEARAYDLILCDVRMPELDGPSLYRRLERQQPHLCPRLIFLTGDTLEPATQAFLEASGAPCLLKPFTIAEARRVIQRTLHGADGATLDTGPA